MPSAHHDVAVIGGGVNGCGIARDLAGRGAKVLLLEANDLASGTSSASSKLIHGGLRYLEHYEFGLVRESLSERERLWAIAPHIIWPMRFVLPHVKGLRPRWLLRLGLFAYDHLGARKRLPATQTIRLKDHPAGAALRPEFDHGFVYSDCWVDDARLVVLNARDAADRGADIRTRCPVTRVERQNGNWRIETAQGAFEARAIVNAAGPSVIDMIGRSGETADRAIRLVRGSHIVVPKLFDHAFPYFFQLPDGRIFFAIPYEQDFTLIGTTDADHHGDLDHITASDAEIAYLCDGASLFFRTPVRPDQVVWSYAGVRPLVDDGSGKPEAATRGYRLEITPEEDGAPMLSVFGGKITTYRHLAEEVVQCLGHRQAELDGTGWTDTKPLPGGDFPCDAAPRHIAALAERFPYLKPAWVDRLFRCYGTVAGTFLEGTTSLSDCGPHFGHGLTAREVDHLMAREWAMSADDILWRRTKLGLRLSVEERQRLQLYMEQRREQGRSA
jgi:glycerol-3-phosphate dehydrogenase